MKTFQDFQAVGQNEQARMAFILDAITEHKASVMYRTAADADQYYRHLNPTIMRYEKLVRDVFGKEHIDTFAPNHKIPCRYYYYFINQTVMFLLSNGVSFSKPKTKEALGGSGFDMVVQELAIKAMNAGVAFGFLNVDHVEVMPFYGGPGEVSFVPLYDEENGALSAGIRYWQLDPDKPLRCTLFEMDGLTEYEKPKNGEMAVKQEKRPYKLKIGVSEASGMEILGGDNWTQLPVVPLWNTNKQSELIGGKSTLDSYDLMLSDLVNNVSEGNLIYWVIQNADGMNEADDQAFVERLKTIRVAHTNDNQQISPVTLEAPYQANEMSLERLRKQLFEDYMALDVQNIAGGAATATQIEAAYEPMNIKSGLLESQVTKFILGLLKLLGIDDAPTYQRDMIVNKAEEVQTVLQCASYLSDEYTLTKLLTILGDIDVAREVKKQRLIEDTERYTTKKKEAENKPTGSQDEEEQEEENNPEAE